MDKALILTMSCRVKVRKTVMKTNEKHWLRKQLLERELHSKKDSHAN